MLEGIGREDLVKLTDDIWSSMLDIKLSPTPTATIEGFKVAACIQIVGEWEGAVQLDLSPNLAREAAAVFMSVSPGEVSAEQVRDAAGELANMTAGSLKTMLPKPCRLSLPSVIDGNDFEVTVHNGAVVLHSGFECSLGSLVVKVLERRDAQIVQ